MDNKIILGAVTLLAILAGALYLLYAIQPASSSVNNPFGGTNSGENAEPGGQVHGLPAEPAAVVARKDLATKLGVSEGSIVIMRVEDKTWSDGCLGLGGPAESCIAALTDGFRVEMEAKGKSYVYRTDKTGLSVRLEP